MADIDFPRYDPSPPRRIDHVRRRVDRYLRARGADLIGAPAAPATRQWLQHLLDLLNERPAALHRAPADRKDTVSRVRLTDAWKHRYEADARFARAFLSGAIAAALVGAHRLWLADPAGAGASLGMAFTLAAFALGPAHRCWKTRTRAPVAGREFLRRPSRWWPTPLPPDHLP